MPLMKKCLKMFLVNLKNKLFRDLKKVNRMRNQLRSKMKVTARLICFDYNFIFIIELIQLETIKMGFIIN